MLIDEVRQLAIDQVDFSNDELESLVEAQNAAYGELHKSTLNFQTAASGADIDPTPGASALVKLAGKIGNQQPDITPDQAAETKVLINEIYSNPNAGVESAGEELFSSALDFIVKAKELDRYVNALSA